MMNNAAATLMNSNEFRKDDLVRKGDSVPCIARIAGNH
jgi:hypothetical protein